MLPFPLSIGALNVGEKSLIKLGVKALNPITSLIPKSWFVVIRWWPDLSLSAVKWIKVDSKF